MQIPLPVAPAKAGAREGDGYPVPGFPLWRERRNSVMIPGEIFTAPGEIEINAGRQTVTLPVANTGDRPIQVGSHYHFYETNAALAFDREQARGYRLDIPAGTATRFEPGQSREVRLVAYAGERRIVGFNGKISGKL